MAVSNTRQWVVHETKGFDGLQLQPNASVPKLDPNEVLVRMHCASLNYRDLIIAKGSYPFGSKTDVVPGSDGAGEVVSTGAKVTRFKPGDKVVTLFNQAHIAGPMTPEIMQSGLGGSIDGTLREHAVFNEQGLVSMPSNLTYAQASTLTCAGVTAWDALYGGQNPLKQGDVVLTQGTGGVSVFAVQFAVAAGATVISTTSSDSKAKTLKQLGAKHVLNYKTDPDWGATAKSLTANGGGVDHIIEVGGPKTVGQSFKAIKMGGTISIIGFLGGMGADEGSSSLQALSSLCTLRGILVGSREQFEYMNRAIETNDIKPVVDQKTFKLDELPQSYQYQWEQRHFGKVVINIS